MRFLDGGDRFAEPAVTAGELKVTRRSARRLAYCLAERTLVLIVGAESSNL